MTQKEIEKLIKREYRHIERIKAKRRDMLRDISAVKEAIQFWKGQLKKAKAAKK